MAKTLPLDELSPVVEEACRRLEGRPKLQKLFRNCYPNTMATTTKYLEDGTAFVFTGDLPAMRLRDSSAQVRPSLRAAQHSAPAAGRISCATCRSPES